MGLLPAILGEIQRLRLAVLRIDTNPFGSGTDGDVVISSNTTLSPAYLAYNNLTIDPGVVVTSSISPLYIVVKDTLTVEGALHVDGLGAAGGTSVGSTNPGASGDPGIFYDWNGAVGASTLRSATAPGGNTGGPAPSGNFSPDIGRLHASTLPFGQLFFMTGSGGGESGSSQTGQVPGGNGGGTLYVFARNIVVPSGGLISANGASGTVGTTGGNTPFPNGTGGDGGVGFNVGGAGGGGGNFRSGGGGGGAGGSVILIYETLSVGGNIIANGGAGGDDGTGSFLGGVGGTTSIANPVTFNVTAPTSGATAGPSDSGSGGGGGDSGLIIPIQVS